MESGRFQVPVPCRRRRRRSGGGGTSSPDNGVHTFEPGGQGSASHVHEWTL